MASESYRFHAINSADNTGKTKEDLRTIRVDFYPKHRYCDFEIETSQGQITAEQVKERVVMFLEMESCNSMYFGLFSGSLYNPVTLYSGKDTIPEDVSQYVFLRLSFCINREESFTKQDAKAEELICLEMMDQYSKNLVLPIPDSATRQHLDFYAEQGLMTDFWKTLNNHSQCVAIEGFASSQIFKRKNLKSLSDNLIALKVGVDLQGMHIFAEDGRRVILSCSWTSMTNIRMYQHPEKLFMFDLVVEEDVTRFLRSFAFYTSSCEYLFSLVKYIYRIHEIYPEVFTENCSQGHKYVQQFESRYKGYQLYILKKCMKQVPFKMYAHEGLSKSVVESIQMLNPCYLEKSYAWPYIIYRPNESASHLHFKEMKLQTYQIHHFLRWSSSRSELSNENITTVRIPYQPGDPTRVKNIKQSVAKNLHLDDGSLKYFGLFVTNKSGNRIELLQNTDVMPLMYEGLSFQVLNFDWSRDSNDQLWKDLVADESATNLIFWEVVAGHGGKIRDANLIWSKLMFTRSIYDLLYALTSITDLYSIGNCILWDDLPISVTTSEKYLSNGHVIVSLDLFGIHLWDPSSGKRIVSWRWLQIVGVKKISIPVHMVVLYFDEMFNSDNLKTISFQTESAGFFYSIAKILLSNSINPADCHGDFGDTEDLNVSPNVLEHKSARNSIPGNKAELNVNKEKIDETNNRDPCENDPLSDEMKKKCTIAEHTAVLGHQCSKGEQGFKTRRNGNFLVHPIRENIFPKGKIAIKTGGISNPRSNQRNLSSEKMRPTHFKRETDGISVGVSIIKSGSSCELHLRKSKLQNNCGPRNLEEKNVSQENKKYTSANHLSKVRRDCRPSAAKKSWQASSRKVREFIKPSILVVTSSEDLEVRESEDAENLAHSRESELRQNKEEFCFGNSKSEIKRDFVKESKPVHKDFIVMDVGEDAITGHLDDLLQVQTTSAAKMASVDSRPSSKETLAEKILRWESSVNIDDLLLSREDCTELEVPCDTVVAECFRYYGIHGDKRHWVQKRNNFPYLRNMISFCEHPHSQGLPPPHFTQIISLLSKVSPNSNGKYFFRCFDLLS